MASLVGEEGSGEWPIPFCAEDGTSVNETGEAIVSLQLIPKRLRAAPLVLQNSRCPYSAQHSILTSQPDCSHYAITVNIMWFIAINIIIFMVTA